jgi:NitT/TauT family transport system permease protein
MLSGDALPIVIAFLMVMPIIMQNLLDGFDAIDRELLEVCRVFELSFFKKMKILIAPTLLKYFIPAVITATGLAWKSEIAAEIIAYTKNSIGEKINDAKYFYESPTVFAWTVIIIFMSILLETITKYLLRRCKK